MKTGAPPLVVHIVHRFDTGGLENGVVNLINHMPAGAYRHAVVALTEVTDFAKRIRHAGVECHALHKPPGQTFRIYPALYRLLRRLRPAIVHTRNLAPLETQAAAWAAGVPVRIHGEHGRDVGDLDGSNRTYQRVRRVYRPFVHHYFALSRDLQQYLIERVGVPAARITQVYNGVDALQFHPRGAGSGAVAGCPFHPGEHWVLGTVGRMQEVKDQPTLARAFVLALQLDPGLASRLRLVMVGDGPLRSVCQALLEAAGVAHLAWLPGERSDVAEVLRGLDGFVLPSLAEGVSNTILEAMATGLPVVATAVGGNPELVEPGRTGVLVPSADPRAMADAIAGLARDPAKARELGGGGRTRVERQFSLAAMVQTYRGVYDRLLASHST